MTGARPFLTGNNNELAEIHQQNLKISFPEPQDQYQPNLAQSILG